MEPDIPHILRRLEFPHSAKEALVCLGMCLGMFLN